MKKPISVLLLLALLCGMLLTACTDDPVQQQETYTLTLDKSTLSLQVYGQYTLQASVKDSQGAQAQQTLLWESSDEKVAKVTDGTVMACGEGEAVITARLADGTQAQCKVTCEDPGIAPVLVLANCPEGKLAVELGQPFTLQPQVTLGGADATDADTVFTFRSSDAAVAAVSESGVITALAEGTVSITVMAAWRGLGGESLEGGEAAYGLRTVIEFTVVKP